MEIPAVAAAFKALLPIGIAGKFTQFLHYPI